MLSYAGQGLVQLSSKQWEQILARLPLVWAEQAHRSLPILRGTPTTGRPGLWPPVPFTPNVLYWPTGASRWACGWFAVDESGATAARLGATGADLIITDGIQSITTTMYPLPLIPLHRVTTDTLGLYLLPLVDERYFWWGKHGTITVTEGTTTWAGLYGEIATALDILLTVDTVASEHLLPSSLHSQKRGPLPPLLDRVAFSCGQKVVRGLNGSVATMNAQTSLDLHRQNLASQESNRLMGRWIETGGV